MSDWQITPPLLGAAPPTVCGYMSGGVVCAKPATWHIIWNPEMDNGAACDEHYEASKRWAWYTSHRMNDVCREGGGYVVFLSDGGDSTCVHDDDNDELLASIAQGIQRHVDLDTGRLLPVPVPVWSRPMTTRGPLHVRPDEEPDVDYGHFIERTIYMYPGCRFCGHEDHHRREDCPNRPGYTQDPRPLRADTVNGRTRAAETAPEHT